MRCLKRCACEERGNRQTETERKRKINREPSQTTSRKSLLFVCPQIFPGPLFSPNPSLPTLRCRRFWREARAWKQQQVTMTTCNKRGLDCWSSEKKTRGKESRRKKTSMYLTLCPLTSMMTQRRMQRPTRLDWEVVSVFSSCPFPSLARSRGISPASHVQQRRLEGGLVCDTRFSRRWCHEEHAGDHQQCNTARRCAS